MRITVRYDKSKFDLTYFEDTAKEVFPNAVVKLVTLEELNEHYEGYQNDYSHLDGDYLIDVIDSVTSKELFENMTGGKWHTYVLWPVVQVYETIKQNTSGDINTVRTVRPCKVSLFNSILKPVFEIELYKMP